ncbi:sodium:solute symporter family protein [Candidatus Aerophobetes bacterium]|nr:sodium:solute symporter family protein [Candidatus Aerophobetes bacterium]
MSEQTIQLIIVFTFMSVALLIGLRGYRITRKEPEDYFLADRSFGTLVLLLTMFASLMSAFTFFGGAGQVYSSGMEWFIVMGIMDGFLVAVFWYLIGSKQWKLGKKYHYITLGEMLGERFGSPFLRGAISIISLFWLFPYLMLQQMGGGYALSGLTGGAISYPVGAGIITLFILTYVVLGGMRGVAWTDVFQGILMIACIWIALVFIGRGIGGPEVAATKVLAEAKSIFTLGDSWTPQMIWSASVSVALGVICFPQINQRFFVGKSEKILQRSFIIWPLLCLLLFLPPFLIGAWGRAIVPGLANPDTVLSVMLGMYTPFWFSALVISGAMAAMMSSADSMLLSASSYLTHDIYKKFLNPRASNKRENFMGRLIVAIFAIFSYLASLLQPGTLVEIGLIAFGGFAQITPLLFLSLYWKKTTTYAIIISLFASESFYMISKFVPGVPDKYFGLDSSIIGVALAACLTIIISSFSTHSRTERLELFTHDT